MKERLKSSSFIRFIRRDLAGGRFLTPLSKRGTERLIRQDLPVEVALSESVLHADVANVEQDERDRDQEQDEEARPVERKEQQRSAQHLEVRAKPCHQRAPGQGARRDPAP